MKLWFTNKRGKVELNKKTINGLRVCSCIFRLLIQMCGSLPHWCEVGSMRTVTVLNSHNEVVTGAMLVVCGGRRVRTRSSNGWGISGVHSERAVFQFGLLQAIYLAVLTPTEACQRVCLWQLSRKPSRKSKCYVSIDAWTGQQHNAESDIVSTNVLGARLLFLPHWNQEPRLPSLFVNNSRHSLSF